MALIVIGFVCIAIGTFVFFIPTYVAFRRDHPNRWPIFVINLVFGGTGIGWFASLIWALHIVHVGSRLQPSYGGQSGLNLFAGDVRAVRLVSDEKVAPAQTSGEAVLEHLRRLVELKEAAHITEQEFQALKSAVLSGVH